MWWSGGTRGARRRTGVLSCSLALVLSSCIVEIEGDAAGECSDGVDNDQDGVTDCADLSCAAATICVDGPGRETGTDDSEDGSSGADSGEPDTDVDTGETDAVGETGDSGPLGDSGDSGSVGDSGAVGDSGSGDSGSVGDSGAPVEACAPPDAWTGVIDPALYSTAPFDPGYDAGLQFAGSRCCSTSGFRYLVLRATVALVVSNRMIYISDGLGTLVADPGRTVALAPGDHVSFAYESVHGRSVVPSTFIVNSAQSDWFVEPGGHPIQVRELGDAPLDHDDGYARITHAYGELAPRSNLDCGADHSCYLFQHQGTQDRIRVPNDNVFGLDADYTGGLCAEVVAPVGRYAGATGTATFLDVHDPAWMRVWPKP